MKYEPIIGIEVHVELKTDSKMFCGCSADHFGVKPNTNTCPVCLGLPGALPVPNEKAVRWCVLIGAALNCEVARESKFDRKNYFYPDLPKGYQISQYDAPFCREGFLNVCGRRIGITRVHMEEDTGKLVHKKVEGEEATLVDFNRSGVPLVEIVSEPDITSSGEAVAYLKKLQQVVRYLGVSDCEMSEGTMRCEANVSLKKRGVGSLPSYKVEIKNLNSFKFVEKALNWEIERQTRILDKGETPDQETRGFNVEKGKTFSQRTKEMAHDYRYFPEPDIPEIVFSEEEIESIKGEVPELPDEKKERFKREFSLSEKNASLLSSAERLNERLVGDYFEKAASFLKEEKVDLSFEDLANVIVNRRLDVEDLSPREVVEKLVEKEKRKVKDKGKLEEVVVGVIKENEEAVKDWKEGKKEAMGYLMGQVMKKTKGRADGEVARELLVKELKKL